MDINKKILRLPEVIDRTGNSRSTIYAQIKNQQFPPPINLGVRAVGWLENEINEWIENRIQDSRGK
jgi:prophage regulatory protein